MKKILLLCILITISLHSFSASPSGKSENTIITIGILQGGGSLIGVDVEQRATDRIGIQLGGGLFGYGGGINYHLQPGIRSSCISFQYIHQGYSTYSSNFRRNVFLAENSALTATYVYRARRWFTCQIGLAYSLDPENQDWTFESNDNPIFLMYSIGVYLPF
ncbi:hypothetical protein ACE01N_00825 [Saccharicrinis sp. FJH2]|uniref:hypothetical protein n=1 Tax=Saccharicrinis sp. FJH65 TaxID=3344659 RepID=UPI0035F23973